jgi:nuclear GTP-binding protein
MIRHKFLFAPNFENEIFFLGSSVTMGKGKKEKNRRAAVAATAPDGMSNVKVKGENFYRDAAKVKKVNMYKDGKPTRNANGDIIKAASYQSKEIPKARVEPNRRWFGSTRVIAQDALAEFRERIGSKIGLFPRQ